MYAIIESGGFQFKVSPGDVVELPKIDKKEGTKISFPNVLFFRDGEKTEAGKPYLKNVKVEGELLQNFKDTKVLYFRYQRRENYERKKGFRRELSQVKIAQIKTD